MQRSKNSYSEKKESKGNHCSESKKQFIRVKKFSSASLPVTGPNLPSSDNKRRSTTTSSRIKVVASELPASRWPVKQFKKEELMTKPWYMLSFDETVELCYGDELRNTAYSKYNKSFVTKIKEEKESLVAFGSTLSLDESLSSCKPKLTPETKYSTSSSLSLSQESTLSVNDDCFSNKNAMRKSTQRSIKGRKLKVNQLESELMTIRAKIRSIELKDSEQSEALKDLLIDSEESLEKLNELRAKVTKTVESTKSSLSNLIKCRSSASISTADDIGQSSNDHNFVSGDSNNSKQGIDIRRKALELWRAGEENLALFPKEL